MSQVDNPLQEAAYPVLLACPTIPQRIGMGIVADTVGSGPMRSAAVTMRSAVWRHRPAGVVCLERLEVSPTHSDLFQDLHMRVAPS